MIALVGGHDWLEALAIDLGLTLFYACVFHLVCDRLRPAVSPVAPEPGGAGGG